MIQEACLDPIRCRPAVFCLITLLILLGLLFGPLAPRVRAEEPGEPITVGRTVTIHSAALGEDRTILVTTPAGYDRGSRKYPVIYVLDGETNHLLAAAVSNFFWQNGVSYSVGRPRHFPSAARKNRPHHPQMRSRSHHERSCSTLSSAA